MLHYLLLFRHDCVVVVVGSISNCFPPVSNLTGLRKLRGKLKHFQYQAQQALCLSAHCIPSSRKLHPLKPFTESTQNPRRNSLLLFGCCSTQNGSANAQAPKLHTTTTICYCFCCHFNAGNGCQRSSCCCCLILAITCASATSNANSTPLCLCVYV